MTLYVLLAILVILAVVCTVLRKKAVRWLFTLLAVVFWIAFLALCGFIIGYQYGDYHQQVSMGTYVFSTEL